MADLLAALREGEALPATGTAHGHVRLKDGRLARIAYAYEDDPTAAARDPSDPSQWSDAGLEPAMKVHLRARIGQCFDRDSIRALRAEWL